MPPAELTPRFPPGGVPLSILVDYDGTISLADGGDAMLAELVADQAAVAEQDRRYDAGEVGSRELMRWDMDMLPNDPALLRGRAAAVPQDEGLIDLVQLARDHGAAVEVVSDGFGFHVQPNLARLGLDDIPVATNANPLERGAGMSWPYGHPACFVCGTCKRERVRAHQAAHRLVAFVGDGTSDRYAAHHADLLFAKDKLADWCRGEGVAHTTWGRLADVVDQLRNALVRAELPATASEVAAWRAARAAHASGRPSFICGPEVWGPGRELPLR